VILPNELNKALKKLSNFSSTETEPTNTEEAPSRAKTQLSSSSTETETKLRTCTRVTKTQQNRTEPRKTLRNHPTRAKTHHSSSSSEPRTEPRTRLKILRKHPVELGRTPATAQPERVEALLKRTKRNRTSETPKTNDQYRLPTSLS
jgi:hypothetical protein